jgi:PST family polysaccharide transporter
MKLFSTTIFSGITAFVKIASGFIATKVISGFAGPAGVALVGSLTNFMAVMLSLANGSVNSGIVKYTAEFKSDSRKSKILYDTSIFISVVCSAIVSLVLLLFSKYWSEKIFHNVKYQSVIVLFGLGIIFYSLNTILLAILNGLGYIKKYTIINGLSSIFTLVLTIVLIYYYNVTGALYALVLSQFLVFFVACLLVVKHLKNKINFDFLRPDFTTIKNLSHFSVMAIVSSSAMPLAQILIRNFITKEIDLDHAGIWQGLIRISDGYHLIFNITLGTYFLPKLSALKDNSEIKKEVVNGIKFLAPLFLLMCLGIYLGRFYIIQILYSEKFFAMQELFFWQLAGDFFKVLSLIFSYLMLSKVMTKTFITTEVLFAFVYVVLSLFFVPSMGLQGASIAFFVTFLACFILMILIFRKTLFVK